ncbi:hypothetical protein BP5796_04769 [Coleophoma crateriformis]|uniref:Extensin domain-containing protein n=1 Tax=Coleophoma crateriformis TaxID=565419 RepID=A0A3D8SBZ3_9HELO|nr:hypothetical protein BP5796_04769 [Coleophoma crateriformis]
MGVQDLFAWCSQNATASIPGTAEDDIAADADEPPDHTEVTRSPVPEFQRSAVRLQNDRKESLLTKALQHSPEEDSYKPNIHVKTDLLRRRSLISNTSLASTADLTSDGGLTSPARTNTPSPPIPETAYTSFAPMSLGQKPIYPIPPPMITSEKKVTDLTPTKAAVNTSSENTPAVETPKKRCITFACGGRKPSEQAATKPVEETKKTAPVPAPVEEAPKRRCIKFACPGPRPSENAKQEVAPTPNVVERPKVSETTKRSITARSPSLTRKARNPPRHHRDSTGTIRRASQSPVAVRARPKFIADEGLDLDSSDATRFTEFARGELQDDDWIRRDNVEELSRLSKLTITDTLKKENAIRQLGNEAEEEALADEEDENDDGYDSDDENRDDDDDDSLTFNGGSDVEDDFSDGNETDNEAGFAESDDESDGEYQFWTPGRTGALATSGEHSTYRASAHRTASTSSIDSLEHMRPLQAESDARRGKVSRRIRIRPGTPDLPDSTDFVCGTLDEDRPLEDAYISCMEARKQRRRLIPQDIDPSFPTSDPEAEEDEHDILEPANDSEEHVWLHGEFEEDSDTGRVGRRRSTVGHRSPRLSPRRLHSPAPLKRLVSPPPPKRRHSPPPPKRRHSPPPAKRRLHSPPPRKLFGHSPRRMRSPPPSRTIHSPTASPSSHTTSAAITFAQLGSRTGVTHTKSLPRSPNAFCRAYRASRLIAANGNDPEDGNDAHIRGAIDIVKGLEHKRQRRKEKFYQKQCNRARKCPEKRPQPGKGAERMRELGLLMAGKSGQDQNPYILSA